MNQKIWLEIIGPYHYYQLLEKFWKRLYNFLDTMKIITKSQYGFQKNKSTEDALTKIVGAFENKKVSCIFLDFAKASQNTTK